MCSLSLSIVHTCVQDYVCDVLQQFNRGAIGCYCDTKRVSWFFWMIVVSAGQSSLEAQCSKADLRKSCCIELPLHTCDRIFYGASFVRSDRRQVVYDIVK